MLAPLADQIVHFGGVGTGTAYKLIVNLIGAVQIASVAEGLALAERVGLDLDQFAAALATGQAASPQVVRNARRLAADAHGDVVFAGRLRRKDVDYARRLATELGAPAPFGRVAHDLLDDLIATGWAISTRARSSNCSGGPPTAGGRPPLSPPRTGPSLRRRSSCRRRGGCR